ncbi:hypothetical protein GQ53DRAFT_852023 [Thozetella sp. PMI_491]|nr:hypothetical protein GQ53DRAFT_852023 [Thozetella sp. PMI_491]
MFCDAIVVATIFHGLVARGIIPSSVAILDSRRFGIVPLGFLFGLKGPSNCLVSYVYLLGSKKIEVIFNLSDIKRSLFRAPDDPNLGPLASYRGRKLSSDIFAVLYLFSTALNIFFGATFNDLVGRQSTFFLA